MGYDNEGHWNIDQAATLRAELDMVKQERDALSKANEAMDRARCEALAERDRANTEAENLRAELIGAEAERDRLRAYSDEADEDYLRVMAERDSLRKTLAHWNSEHPEEAEHDAEMGRLSRVLEEVKAERDEANRRVAFLEESYATVKAAHDANAKMHDVAKEFCSALWQSERENAKLRALLMHNVDHGGAGTGPGHTCGEWCIAEPPGIAPGKDEYR